VAPTGRTARAGGGERGLDRGSDFREDSVDTSGSEERLANSGADEDVVDLPPDIPASIRYQTETPAFKRWFGDSKVVDENGKPLVVYHGTNRDFDAFDLFSEPSTGGGKRLHRYQLRQAKSPTTFHQTQTRLKPRQTKVASLTGGVFLGLRRA